MKPVCKEPVVRAALGDGVAHGSSETPLCRWCQESPVDQRRHGIYCSRKCRQSAWRLRQRRTTSPTPGATALGRFAYADPPYPGLAARYYRHQPDYQGEVDHPALIASLAAAVSDGSLVGWALSTSSEALRDLLPLCPPGARVCAWCHMGGVPPATFGLHARWEAVIVVGGRRLRPGVRDWLACHPARGGGTLPGRKPIAFCAWLFDCLGMLPGDQLDDLFPGSGIVSRAWGELSARAVAAAGTTDASSSAGADRRQVLASLLEDRHVVEDVPGDAQGSTG